MNFTFRVNTLTPPKADIDAPFPIYRARRSKKTLDDLPFDILVDHILSLLDVKDVLSLRRTNKFFSTLTQEAAIWKRLLEQHRGPRPPLPPTARHSLGQMHAFEAERQLSRALTFTRNWASPEPTPYDTYSFDTHFRVHNMTILPGGHFLVASVSTKGRTKFEVVLFALDYRSKGRQAYPLATVSVKTKAYDMQAKYMYIGEEHGIAISYTRRQNPKHRPGPDPSILSDKYEIDERMNYETVVTFISLTTLETLADIQPQFRPGTNEYRLYIEHLPAPFKRIAVIRSRSPLCCPSLEYLNGMAYLCIVRRPGTLMYKNLEREENSAHCFGCLPSNTPEDHDHTILAYRNLPFERKVIVVKRFLRRALDAAGKEIDTPMMSIELYHPLYDWDLDRDALDGYSFEHAVRSVHIAEPQLPYFGDDAARRQAGSGAFLRPPVISIYCRGANPDRFLLMECTPRIVDIDREWELYKKIKEVQCKAGDWRARLYLPHFYDLDLMNPVAEFQYPEAFGTAFVLPGNGRAALWAVPADDRTDAPKLISIWSFIRSENDADLLPREQEDAEWPARKPDGTRRDCFMPVVLEEEVRNRFERGVQAMAWDESIGRLCVCAAESSEIYVLDFAKNVKDVSVPVHK